MPTTPTEYYTSIYSGEEIDAAISKIKNITGADIPVSGEDDTDLADALAGKAPAGFGLGGSAKHLTADNDLNTIWQSGFYYWAGSAPQNAPTSYGVMLVISRGNDTMIQEVTTVTGTDKTKYRRVIYNATNNGYPDWEYVNPPLAPGVEYRTTERYNGKPVYVKLVDFGALPNNSIKLVEYAGGDATTRTIEAHGVMSGGSVIPGATGSSGYPSQMLDIITNNIQVGVITHKDRSSETAQFVVKYWRTSD